MAIQEFKATVSLKEGLFVEANARGFTVQMDEPEQLGGTNKAMNPVEMLLSALGGCLSITIAAFSKAAHVEIEDCKVHVTGDLDPDGFLGLNKDVRKGFTQIRYQVELVSNSPEDKIKKLMQMVEEKCPVSDTLKGVEVIGDVKIVR
ncbi:OsmC family protein [Tepidibacillus fermentans]|uniref:Putative OsmC-like protein n=1 Tax=Tepidibacillus fermentans TaxID=1281767 RepID=A0A4R3KKZ0_9BACI|nr:OsmC family protein [Tepidibacillus fermentans]TCS84182.1 putative OsmC-like protein [Tepidibacillus fermentans]